MQGAGADSGGGKLEFEDFVGVAVNQLREAGAIRGVNGGGLPWGIGEAEVRVRASGGSMWSSRIRCSSPGRTWPATPCPPWPSS